MIAPSPLRCSTNWIPGRSFVSNGLVLHRTRHLFIRQQTSVINAIRAHLAEFGIVAPVGTHEALTAHEPEPHEAHRVRAVATISLVLHAAANAVTRLDRNRPHVAALAVHGV
jgi:transposase